MNPSANSKSSWKLPRLKDELLSLKNNKFNVPFLAIAETWLKDSITDAEINLNLYNVYRGDRQKSAHGGVLLYIHHKIVINNFSTYDDDICQGVFCFSKLCKCVIGCIYRPPTSGNESFSNLLKFLENFISQFNPNNEFNILIFGDFNFPKANWKTPHLNSSICSDPSPYQLFFNFMNTNFLSQYVEQNTRKQNILDLFLTDDPNFVHLIKCEDLLISDHNLVKIYTNFFSCLSTDSYGKIASDTSCLTFSDFNLPKANFDKINLNLNNTDWNEFVESTSINDFPAKFKNKIFSIVQENCPRKSTNHVKSNSFIKERQIISRKIRKFNKILLKSVSTQQTVSSFSFSTKYINDLKEKILKLRDKQKSSYINQRKFQEDAAVNRIKSDIKYFYKYTKRFKNTVSSPSLLIDSKDNLINSPLEIANALQDHFKTVFSIPNSELDSFLNFSKPKIVFPLPDFTVTTQEIIAAINQIKTNSASPYNSIPAFIIKNCKFSLAKPLKLFCEKSFNLGIVPNYYKSQQITPIFKKGSKTCASNYRPVALTPHVIKINERAIREKLVKFFEENNILNSNQHGFRKNRSCLTQLLFHIQNIFDQLLTNTSIDSIYIDYAKAFDKVDHGVLINKLKFYGVPNQYLVWINSFLSNRFQTVFINGVSSYRTKVTSGVPQGSVLGPLLFIIFINDLSEQVTFSKILTFADDTKLVFPVNSQNDQKSLQQDLDSVIHWTNCNNMQLNKTKFELLTHSFTKNNTELDSFQHLPFFSDFFQYETEQNLFLSSSTHVRDLGLFITPQLDWDVHISNIYLKATKTCAWILNVFSTRSKFVMLTLFNSLVRSKLEYCSELWDPIEIKHIDKIEQIQRNFTRKITNMKQFNYWTRLEKLQIMSLQRRREKQIIILVWKLKNNSIPNDINLEFEENKYNSKIKAVFKPLPRKTGKLQSSFENSFIIKGAKLWNKLPPNLTKISNIHSFRTRLDKFLKLFPDEPPVHGYYHKTKNSILNYNIPNEFVLKV